jgi:uncharacterized membrane protein
MSTSETPPPPPPAAAAGEDRTVAILSYITIIGFVVAIVMHGSKKTALGSFHLRQALGIFLTGLVCWPLNIVLAFIPILGWLCILGIVFGLIALWIMGLIGAASGQLKPVPVLGDKYQQWFSNAFT